MREKENELKRLQAQAKVDDIDDQINQLSSKPTTKSKKRAPRKKAPAREETESESEESESEESSEESEEESEEEYSGGFVPTRAASEDGREAPPAGIALPPAVTRVSTLFMGELQINNEAAN